MRPILVRISGARESQRIEVVAMVTRSRTSGGDLVPYVMQVRQNKSSKVRNTFYEVTELNIVALFLSFVT